MEGSVQLPFSSAVTADIFLQITSTLSHLSSLYNRSSQTLTGSHFMYTYTSTLSHLSSLYNRSSQTLTGSHHTYTYTYTPSPTSPGSMSSPDSHR